MEAYESKVRDFLSKTFTGDAELSNELCQEFASLCYMAIKKQFQKKKEDYRYRMSQIGSPVCQQQFDKLGHKGEEQDYNLGMKFLIGDLVEAAVVVVLKAAGVDVGGIQENLVIDVGGHQIPGTKDIDIEGKVWDIKSCSDYAFSYKFSQGFEKVAEGDSFGYVPQGYLYAKASKKPFGGWVAVEKSTGKITFCEAPVAGRSYEKKALKTVEDNLEILENTKSVDDVQRCFEPEPELYYNKKTGKKVLNVVCSYCKHKQECWKGQIELKQVRNTKQKKWYFK